MHFEEESVHLRAGFLLTASGKMPRMKILFTVVRMVT